MARSQGVSNVIPFSKSIRIVQQDGPCGCTTKLLLMLIALLVWLWVLPASNEPAPKADKLQTRLQ